MFAITTTNQGQPTRRLGSRRGRLLTSGLSVTTPTTAVRCTPAENRKAFREMLAKYKALAEEEEALAAWVARARGAAQPVPAAEPTAVPEEASDEDEDEDDWPWPLVPVPVVAELVPATPPADLDNWPTIWACRELVLALFTFSACLAGCVLGLCRFFGFGSPTGPASAAGPVASRSADDDDGDDDGDDDDDDTSAPRAGFAGKNSSGTSTSPAGGNSPGFGHGSSSGGNLSAGSGARAGLYFAGHAAASPGTGFSRGIKFSGGVPRAVFFASGKTSSGSFDFRFANDGNNFLGGGSPRAVFAGRNPPGGIVAGGLSAGSAGNLSAGNNYSGGGGGFGLCAGISPSSNELSGGSSGSTNNGSSVLGGASPPSAPAGFSPSGSSPGPSPGSLPLALFHSFVRVVSALWDFGKALLWGLIFGPIYDLLTDPEVVEVLEILAELFGTLAVLVWLLGLCSVLGVCVYSVKGLRWVWRWFFVSRGEKEYE